MNPKGKVILSALASVFCVLPLYILLHEGGHALTAVLCGARVTRFSILDASMSYEGGTFTAASSSLLNAAGMLLPVLLSVVYMLTYRKGAISIPYRIFSFMFLLVPVCSVLAWVIVPVLYLAGKAPQNDDVTKFINHSGLSPWAVLTASILLFVFCLFLAWKKKIIQNYWAALSLRNT